jgi:hypothetical protein
MGLVTVAELTVGDDPASWQDAGFTVDGSCCTIGDVMLRLGGGRTGITSWTLVHPDRDAGPTDLDGLATTLVAERSRPDRVSHPNGVTGIDHIVVSSPDIDRTTAAFAGIDVDERRTRDTTAGDAPLRQRFFRMGTIIELIGPPEPDPAAVGRPARFWGLALVSDDLDETAAAMGDRLGRAKDAVQPGRRIATVHTRDSAISVPIAVMSPHVR